ncbi:hypothetical protein FHS59_001448 [Algoriphagus iocasae]|jgi:hypothetical protein|uniref:DUF3299 domain-containing protein n=1 Tax=Algoriphagus iocasae TaxID=1836499 RepID=A0A841MG88_9BACT|nr:DUF3299 domain-containing protein [Algoriphagus iocasae]MBB6325833.1 hypothetical protein [Algoriphagus iocasae]
MLRISLTALLLLISIPVFSQTKITWDTLTDVTFIDKYSEEVDAYYYFPKFGPSILALNNKEVIIKGYLLIIDPDNDIYILSANPFAACFFCGGAGPESIIELKIGKDHPRFKMDEVLTFRGKLKLNAVDIYQCNYILENARVYQ